VETIASRIQASPECAGGQFEQDAAGPADSAFFDGGPMKGQVRISRLWPFMPLWRTAKRQSNA
jgi:hypothetical protein